MKKIIISLACLFIFSVNAKAMSPKEVLEKCFDMVKLGEIKQAYGECLAKADKAEIDAEMAKNADKLKDVKDADIKELAKIISPKIIYTITDEVITNDKAVVKVKLEIPDLITMVMNVMGEIMMTMGMAMQDPNAKINTDEIAEKIKTNFKKGLEAQDLKKLDFDFPVDMVLEDGNWKIFADLKTKKEESEKIKNAPFDSSPMDKSKEAVSSFLDNMAMGNEEMAYGMILDSNKSEMNFDEFKKKFGFDKPEYKENWKTMEYRCYSSFGTANSYQHECELTRADLKDGEKINTTVYEFKTEKENDEYKVDVKSIKKIR